MTGICTGKPETMLVVLFKSAYHNFCSQIIANVFSLLLRGFTRTSQGYHLKRTESRIMTISKSEILGLNQQFQSVFTKKIIFLTYFPAIILG